MVKNLTIISFLGFLAVLFGAFGAHALKEILTISEMNSFNTAVQYQMFHVLVLLFVNVAMLFSEKQKNKLSLIFFIGILFFSGSIYLIYLAGISFKHLWYVTPFGGLFLLIGWLLMAYYAFKKKQKK